MLPEVHTLLVRFREALEHVRMPADEVAAATDLVDYLMGLSDSGKLTAPFLKLALEPFQDVAEITKIVGPLVRFAAHQSAALGHREFQRSNALPWIASSYSALDARMPQEGFTWPLGLGISPAES